jgi:hypothetical protein
MWSFWQRSDITPAQARALTFPNRSRSYDATRRAVRFWGYYRSMENSFFVSTEALTRLQPTLNPDETGFLGAFDENRDQICAVAAKVYAHGPKGSYDLTAGDF